LQFDLFRWYYRRHRPRLSTFFLNSTAHFQHLFWRQLQPELFSVRPSPREQADYADAILFGYQAMDRLVGHFLEIADDSTTLVLCTALSQQPCLKYEAQGGKMFYRPRDFAHLMAFAGINVPHQVSAAMSEEFHLLFETEDDARMAAQALQALRVDGR